MWIYIIFFALFLIIILQLYLLLLLYIIFVPLHKKIYIYIPCIIILKNKTIVFIIKVRLDDLRKQYNVKLEFK